MADGPDDTEPVGKAAVTSRDWRAELAGATGVGPDASPAPHGRAPLPASWDPGAGAADPHLRAHARPMAAPTVEPAEDVLLPQRLVEALATVIGRRLDGIDARLHGLEGAAPAPAVGELTAAVSELAVRVAGVEQRLGALVPPTGAATLDDVLARLELLRPPAGAATAADVLDRLTALEDNVAPAGSGPPDGPDLAKVLGGRLDAVVARLAALEASVRHTTARLDARDDEPARAGTGPAGRAGGVDRSTFERLERQITELNRILR